MSDRPPPDPALMRRVLAPTPVGREELREPQSGLSLPQRWLLGHIDGEQPLSALATLTGSPPAERLPRDAAKLVALGLALDMGEPGPSASGFGPTTQYGEITLALPLDDQGPAPATASPKRRSVPVALAAVAVLALGGGAAALLGGARTPGALPVAQAASVPPAPASAPVPAVAVAAVEAVPNPELSASAVLEALTVVPRTAASAVPPVPPGPAAATARDPVRPVVAEAPRPLPEVAPAAAPAPAPVPVQAPAPAPVPVPAPQTQVAPAPSPQPTPVVPTVAPPVQAQVPLPSPPPQPVATTTAAPLRPLSTVEPAFPRDGLGLGSRAVVLQARLTIAPNGTVTQVTFPQASATTRPFERAARTALLQWRFPEGSGERSYTQQLRFSEE